MLKNIPLKDVNKSISQDDLFSNIKSINQVSHLSRKIIWCAIFSIFLSLPSTNYYVIFTIIAGIVLLLFVFRYLTILPLYKVLFYNVTLYLILQTGTIFFFTVFLYAKNDTYHLLPFVYIFSSYLASFLLIRLKVINYAKKVYSISTKGNFIKMEKILSSVLSLFLAAIIIFTVFYRLNKWWLNDLRLSSDESGHFVNIFYGGILIIVLVGCTLLPTLAFNPKKYVQGKLIKKHSEYFREKYNLSNKDWYGDL